MENATGGDARCSGFGEPAPQPREADVGVEIGMQSMVDITAHRGFMDTVQVDSNATVTHRKHTSAKVKLSK